MDRYHVFRALLDFVADHYEVMNAKMKNGLDEIEIIGRNGGNEITIKAFVEEEEDQDGN